MHVQEGHRATPLQPTHLYHDTTDNSLGTMIDTEFSGLKVVCMCLVSVTHYSDLLYVLETDCFSHKT